MKKDYAMNVKRSDSGDDSEWEIADMAQWFETWNKAFETAENAFEDPEVAEVVLSIWEDGDIEDFPLHMVKENGIIVQYINGQRLSA